MKVTKIGKSSLLLNFTILHIPKLNFSFIGIKIRGGEQKWHTSLA